MSQDLRTDWSESPYTIYFILQLGLQHLTVHLKLFYVNKTFLFTQQLYKLFWSPNPNNLRFRFVVLSMPIHIFVFHPCKQKKERAQEPYYGGEYVSHVISEYFCQPGFALFWSSSESATNLFFISSFVWVWTPYYQKGIRNATPPLFRAKVSAAVRCIKAKTLSSSC